SGRLRARLDFPRGHDTRMKNTPALDWSMPESHGSALFAPTTIERQVLGTRYFVSSDQPFEKVDTHAFVINGNGSEILEFTHRYSAGPVERVPGADAVRSSSADHWGGFWKGGAAADFSGSSNPLATKLERRMVLSQY